MLLLYSDAYVDPKTGNVWRKGKPDGKYYSETTITASNLKPFPSTQFLGAGWRNYDSMPEDGKLVPKGCIDQTDVDLSDVRWYQNSSRKDNGNGEEYPRPTKPTAKQIATKTLKPYTRGDKGLNKSEARKKYPGVKTAEVSSSKGKGKRKSQNQNDSDATPEPEAKKRRGRPPKPMVEKPTAIVDTDKESTSNQINSDDEETKPKLTGYNGNLTSLFKAPGTAFASPSSYNNPRASHTTEKSLNWHSTQEYDPDVYPQYKRGGTSILIKPKANTSWLPIAIYQRSHPTQDLFDPARNTRTQTTPGLTPSDNAPQETKRPDGQGPGRVRPRKPKDLGNMHDGGCSTMSNILTTIAMDEVADFSGFESPGDIDTEAEDN
ncbi:hypothetical protein BDV96DRAFT_608430 [Lophiotrema nucula]|uniref:Uncharacterized protein n=1 Tax=Lophiotrema nucula TaxID=690887 RepID=A0A6A5YD77_9PLEO|nr:hypothetical protein BDV96DRAFT_608430 [Lophiotrema nucula]